MRNGEGFFLTRLPPSQAEKQYIERLLQVICGKFKREGSRKEKLVSL
jgi:hypothetical protein